MKLKISLLILLIQFSNNLLCQNNNDFLLNTPCFSIIYPTDSLIKLNRVKTIIDLQYDDSVVGLKVLNKYDTIGRLIKRRYIHENDITKSTETYLYFLDRFIRIDSSTLNDTKLRKDNNFTYYFNQHGKIILEIDSGDFNGEFKVRDAFVHKYNKNGDLIFRNAFYVKPERKERNINYSDINELFNLYSSFNFDKEGGEIGEFMYDKFNRVVKCKAVSNNEVGITKYEYFNDTLIIEKSKGNESDINIIKYYFDKKNRIIKYESKFEIIIFIYQSDNLTSIEFLKDKKIDILYNDKNLPIKVTKTNKENKIEIREYQYEYY